MIKDFLEAKDIAVVVLNRPGRTRIMFDDVIYVDDYSDLQIGYGETEEEAWEDFGRKLAGKWLTRTSGITVRVPLSIAGEDFVRLKVLAEVQEVKKRLSDLANTLNCDRGLKELAKEVSNVPDTLFGIITNLSALEDTVVRVAPSRTKARMGI